MTLNTRRILSLVFITAFLTITPAIMLYAAGYRLGSNKLSFERTGMFIIDSEPEGAKVLLNGRTPKTWLGALFNSTSDVVTPAKIKNLLPGEYDLTLELDGFSSWRKTLAIEPGASTFIENVYLFKNNPPLKLKDSPGGPIIFSPDKSRALTLNAGQAAIFNLAGGEEKTIGQGGLKGKNVAWSDDNDKIVVDGLLFDLSSSRPAVNLNRLTPSAFNFKWSGGVLYYQDKSFLYRLNQAGSPEKIIAYPAAGDYLVKDSALYVIEPTEAGAALKTFDLASAKITRTISLPMTINGSFINPGHGLLNLYDRGQRTLYLVNPSAVNAPPLLEVITDLKTADWANNGELVYANDFEIWLYRPVTKEKILLTRLSEVINQAAAHPNNNYVIYAAGNSLKALELDDRERRNQTDLLSGLSAQAFVFDDRGEKLYFLTAAGRELFELSLQ